VLAYNPPAIWIECGVEAEFNLIREGQRGLLELFDDIDVPDTDAYPLAGCLCGKGECLDDEPLPLIELCGDAGEICRYGRRTPGRWNAHIFLVNAI